MISGKTRWEVGRRLPELRTAIDGQGASGDTTRESQEQGRWRPAADDDLSLDRVDRCVLLSSWPPCGPSSPGLRRVFPWEPRISCPWCHPCVAGAGNVQHPTCLTT